MRQQIITGDALTELLNLETATADAVITSPPYFGKRDYGVESQIGLEVDFREYVSAIADVVLEAARVVKADGTIWLNIGDTYVSDTSQHKANGSRGQKSTYSRKHFAATPQDGRANRNRTFYAAGLPSKSLAGIPWRVAFELQGRGLILRSDIIWNQPTARESVKDRPTHSHEYIFLFAKSRKYFYNRNALRTAGGGNIGTVWTVTGSPFPGNHAAVFPPELIEPILLDATRPGGLVVDPFAGTGTVGLLAKQHGRAFLGIELNPQTAELARRRIREGVTANDRERLSL